MPICRRILRSLPIVALALVSPFFLVAAWLHAGPFVHTPESVPNQQLCPPHPDLPAHLLNLNVAEWHQSGHTGKGVKIAILDSGFRDYRAFLGDSLPPRVEARSFRFDQDLQARDSRHGILCAEVIHAIAPDAELLLANWQPDDPASFLAAIRWARQRGARIISCSVVMPGWSDGEGGGSVHRDLAGLLGKGDQPDDLLCVASAGNLALRHWAGSFRAGTDGLHLWAPGRTTNTLTPWGDRPVSVEWTAPVGDDSRYQLIVVDTETGQSVGERLPLPSRGFPCGAIRFVPRDGVEYALKVQLEAGSVGGPLRVVVLGASMGDFTPRGSVSFPGDSPHILAVGAVDHGPSRGWKRAVYSSCGPNAAVLKPELVAPVPFPSRWREEPFSGTSAAAPQVAGLAALWFARYPDRTANQVRNELCLDASDIGLPGCDWETGFGLARLRRFEPQRHRDTEKKRQRSQ